MTKTKNKYDSMSEMIAARNILLGEMFNSAGFAVKIIGDENKPTVIVQNHGASHYAVSGFAHNFKFNFTSKSYHGDILKTVDINTIDGKHAITQDEIIEVLDKSTSRTAYSIQDTDSGMLLSHIVKQDTGKYDAYWTETDRRYFLSDKKLANTISLLNRIGYDNVNTVFN